MCNEGSHTRARVQGQKEYMPAALSRYETALSADKTGCTMRALMTAKKSTLAYRAPSTFSRPASVVTLSLSHHIHRFHQGTDEVDKVLNRQQYHNIADRMP